MSNSDRWRSNTGRPSLRRGEIKSARRSGIRYAGVAEPLCAGERAGYDSREMQVLASGTAVAYRVSTEGGCRIVFAPGATRARRIVLRDTGGDFGDADRTVPHQCAVDQGLHSAAGAAHVLIVTLVSGTKAIRAFAATDAAATGSAARESPTR